MRIILYSGKGGVGKTSLSAATAVRSASLCSCTGAPSDRAWLADTSVAPAGETLQNQIAIAEEMIEEVRAAQHQFDIAALR